MKEDHHAHLDLQQSIILLVPLVIDKLNWIVSLSVEKVLVVDRRVSSYVNFSSTWIVNSVLINSFVPNVNALS